MLIKNNDTLVVYYAKTNQICFLTVVYNSKEEYILQEFSVGAFRRNLLDMKYEFLKGYEILGIL